MEDNGLQRKLRYGHAILHTDRDTSDLGNIGRIARHGVTLSKDDDPDRAAFIDALRAKRPASNWREVLGEIEGKPVQREVR